MTDPSPTDLPVVGVVGGGQLARMAHQATIGLAPRLRVLVASDRDSAALVTPDVVVGDHDDLDDLRAFAAGVDVVTFDHELVDPDHLAALEDEGHVLRPSAAALRFAQDKAHQRTAFAAAGVPVPAFDVVHDLDGLDRAVARFGNRAVLKAARGGYDGRGVWVVDGAGAARDAVAPVLADATAVVVEEHLDLAVEVAVGVVRRPGGATARYATTETVQRDGICVELRAPAALDDHLAREVVAVAERAAAIVGDAGAAGVVAVELFVTREDRVLVNELALRPHNSLHWTIEGAATSQFQNHVRGVADVPLGDVATTAPAVATVNVLGPADGSDPRSRTRAALADPGVAVHLYGKASRPGRKVGHVTVRGDDADDVLGRARRAAAHLTGEEPTT